MLLNDILDKILHDKNGVEIGGPSETGTFIYAQSKNMDNVIFSKNTIWSNHTDEYTYYKGKTGKVIINDAVNISLVENERYDFLFSSHCLEHIANPLKAIQEWLRIIKNDGYIILIVPEKTQCFDHKRDISSFSTLLSQYRRNIGEDDLSTLPEILEKHDLSMDLPAGNIEQFTTRSLDNIHNRCLHHYVYSPDLLKEISTYFKCEFIYTVTDGLNIWFIMKKTCPTPTLTQLADNSRTDKNTSHSYLDLYQRLLQSKKETALNVLEIGIWNGGSIKLWNDFFTNATVYGLDIMNINDVWEGIRFNEKIKLITSTDAYNIDFFTTYFLNANIKCDFMIDDGPHTLESMKHFIQLYSQIMTDDGILIIEDIQSMEWIDILKKEVPDHLKQFIHVYDLRPNKNRYDDIVFTIDKSK